MNPTLIITVEDIICAIVVAIIVAIIFFFFISCFINNLIDKAKQLLERKDKHKHD